MRSELNRQLVQPRGVTAPQPRSDAATKRVHQGPSNVFRGGPATVLVGGMALGFSVLYFLSDVTEVARGGFSTSQLWLTLVAEAAIPVFVVGLAVLQQPLLGRFGMWSAVAYAYSYLAFTGTVVYALVNGTPDYKTLSEDIGAVMLIHGAIMVTAGLGFGFAALRARLFPRWTCMTLMAGVVFVALAQNLPDGAQLFAAGVRDLGFAGMGAAALVMARSRR